MPTWLAVVLALGALLVGAFIALLAVIVPSRPSTIGRHPPARKGEPTELAEALDNDFGKASRR